MPAGLSSPNPHATSRARSDNSQDAFVLSHAAAGPVLVQGMDRNRAVEGDTVAVELFDRDKWSQPSGAAACTATAVDAR